MKISLKEPIDFLKMVTVYSSALRKSRAPYLQNRFSKRELYSSYEVTTRLLENLVMKQYLLDFVMDLLIKLLTSQTLGVKGYSFPSGII